MSFSSCRTLIGVVLLAGLIPFPAMADDLQLDTMVLGQFRENDNLQQETPINGYFGFSAERDKWNTSIDSNMRFFRDFERGWDDYDLYQTVVHVRSLDTIHFDVGRQFVNQGFSAEVIDGVLMKIIPAGHVDFAVYSGVPRTVERGDFNKNDGLLTGFSASLKKVERTSAQFNVAWRKDNIRFQNLEQNDELFFGWNFSRQFRSSWRPTVYSLLEYNAAANVIDTGTAGLDIYPRKWLAVNVEFNSFNANRSARRPTILGLFTAGPLYSGRLASTWTLVPDLLDFEESYSLQSVEVQDGNRSTGHLAEAAFFITLNKIGLSIEPGYYFSKSFGGTLHGVRASFHEQFTKKLYTELEVDYTTYNKVTNNSSSAFSSILWAGYEVVKGLTVSGGAEYNRNNILEKDIRGSMKITWLFDTKDK